MRRFPFILLAGWFLLSNIGCMTSAICKPNTSVSPIKVTFAAEDPNVNEIIREVPADMAALCVIRVVQFYGCNFLLDVELDGSSLGSLVTYTHFVTYVPVGEHVISSFRKGFFDQTEESVHSKIRLEVSPGRAYFFATRFDEGTAVLHLVSEEEAGKLMKKTRRILTDPQKIQ